MRKAVGWNLLLLVENAKSLSNTFKAEQIVPVGRNINLVDGLFVILSFFFDMFFLPDYCFLSSLIKEKKKKLISGKHETRKEKKLFRGTANSPHHQAQYRNGNTDPQTLPELRTFNQTNKQEVRKKKTQIEGRVLLGFITVGLSKSSEQTVSTDTNRRHCRILSSC